MAAVLRNERLRRFSATGLQIIVIAALYFAAGRLGLLQKVNIAGAEVTPLWPPTGIALTALLLLGLRIWPGIALGTLLVTGTIDLNLSALGVVPGDTLAPICAYLMLRRVGFRVELDRLRDGLALVFLGALTGMLISSTVGTGSLVLYGSLPPSGFWPTWSAWYTGDAMGVLVVTPVLLVLRSARMPRDIALYRWIEPAALLAATAGVTLLVTNTTLDLLFLVFPLLIWAVLRFQLAGAAPCVLLVSVLTVVAATDHNGPFTHRSLLGTMITLQALNGSAALTGLLLSAVIAERKSTYRKIEQACIGLAEVVARLDPGDGTPHWPPPRA
ncbi:MULTISPECIES: MASE1 domain-containing protein [Kitasatospora]|uniref:MASE1 domain-containing protein n=1 Tax=Kitasatospora cystarginea TaxID=58350 RepID=A0ABP5QVM5_9ACTN